MSPASGSALQRSKESTDRKLAQGKKMASMVRSGQLLFIDAGSANLAAARSLPEGIGATVATHDPTIASVLAGGTDLTLIPIGGQVNPLIGAAVDGQALRVTLGMPPGSTDRWNFAPGDYGVFVGASSDNTPLTASLAVR